MRDSIESLFPHDEEIPGKYRIESPICQDYYLVDGELRRWHGPLQEVLSPIWVKQGSALDPKMCRPIPQPLGRGGPGSPFRCGAGLRQRPRRLAHHVGGGADPLRSRFTRALLEKREPIVRLLMWEIGKSLREAEREFDRAVAYIRDTIEALKELDRVSSRFVIQQGIIGQIRRAPLGVVLCMGPYNFPLYETFTTLIPSLIMGNTLVLKPPRFGILLFQPLLEAFRDAFPAGVVNTVYGEGETVVQPLLASGRVDVLAFIGTNRVADALRRTHPRPHRLRCVLGLDAKNPAIILPDADLDLAAAECIRGSLTYNGQRCTALKILFVHRRIADEFLEKMAQGNRRAEVRHAVGGGRHHHPSAGAGKAGVPVRTRARCPRPRRAGCQHGRRNGRRVPSSTRRSSTP